jgi:O-antigen/teichoic acid export membrane protein
MVIARKIAYNVVVSSVSKILSTILALVSIGLITRYLGAAGFGEYATVLAFLALFSAVADLGLYSTATREISRPNADEAKIIGNIFSLRLVVSGMVLLVSPIFFWFLPYSLELKEAILIIAASFLFSSSYQVLNGIFQKNLAMDKVAVVELLGKIIQVGMIFFVIKLQLGFLWIIASLLFNMIFSFFCVYVLSKKYVSFKLQFDFSYWKTFIKESYPLGIAALIGFVYFKIDTILLSVMKTSSEVGIYNAAYKVIENITFFPTMMAGLIFPIMSQSIFGDFARFKDISDKTYKIFWIFVVALIVGTMFLSGGIVHLIGGAGFEKSGVVLRILIFALAAIFFSNFSNSILIAGNKQKKLMRIMFLAAVFNVVANLLFIPRYSYMAAAWISVLTEMFVVGATFYVIVKELKYWPVAEKFSGIIASGIVMAIYFYIFSRFNFFLLAISGTVAYLVALWMFGVVKAGDISSIISKKGIQEYETH